MTIRPSVRRYGELWWNHIISPDVVSKAAIAPRRGHGLGSTMWKECAWWAIRYFLVSISLGVRRRRRLGL